MFLLSIYCFIAIFMPHLHTINIFTNEKRLQFYGYIFYRVTRTIQTISLVVLLLINTERYYEKLSIILWHFCNLLTLSLIAYFPLRTILTF